MRVVRHAGNVSVNRVGKVLEHIHSLDDCDRFKRPSVFRVLAVREVANGYSVAVVAKNLRAVNHSEDRKKLFAAGGKWLTSKDVHNACTTWKKQNPASKQRGNNETWQEQALEARIWLEKEGWEVEPIQAVRTCDRELSDGLVFADSKRLSTLCRRGHFVLMDSTHKTNKLRWFLYTLMVRDEHGSWIPGAHILTAREDSDIVATGLKTIKRWCHNQWHLRYMLTDDSAGEQSAVRKAFPGLSAGEMEVSHLLCKVHSQRTLRKALPGEANQRCREHLMAALYNRKTKPGCEESIQAAINVAPRHRQSYVEKEWWETRVEWANYARCHSAILLQVPSTNPVESWHASLKLGVKKEMTQWSLLGSIERLANTAAQWDRKAERSEADFRSLHLSDTTFFPGMRKLPYPVQQLVLGQLQRGNELLAEGADPLPLGDELECDCLFFRQYQLPCAHMWQHEHTFGGVLEEEEVWDRFAFMFEDCGFEIYE
ncbi:MULE transposase domain, partial [Lasallia pustulata]